MLTHAERPSAEGSGQDSSEGENSGRRAFKDVKCEEIILTDEDLKLTDEDLKLANFLNYSFMPTIQLDHDFRMHPRKKKFLNVSDTHAKSNDK